MSFPFVIDKNKSLNIFKNLISQFITNKSLFSKMLQKHERVVKTPFEVLNDHVYNVKYEHRLKQYIQSANCYKIFIGFKC